MRDLEGLTRANSTFGKYNALMAGKDQLLRVDSVVHLDPQTINPYVNAINNILFGSATMQPVRLDSDITNHCTDACLGCFSIRQRQSVPGEIPLDQYKAILSDERVQNLTLVRLTGGGDPTEHTRFPDILEFLGSRFAVFLETHGDLLIRDEISDSVARYVDRPRISVDSGDNQSRLMTHHPLLPNKSGIDESRDYDNLLHGMDKTISLAQKYYERGERKQEMIPGATFVIKLQNYRSLPQFFRDMAGIGVKWVAVRLDIHKQIYDQNPEILPFIQEALTQAEQEYKDVFSLQHPYVHSFQPHMSTQSFQECWTTRLRANLWADQSLHACNLDRNIGLRGRTKEYTEIGIVNNSVPMFTLIEKSSAKVDEIRHKAPKECTFCVDVDPNTLFNDMANILRQDPNTKFMEANVVQGEQTTLHERSALGITQVSLAPKDYEQFMMKYQVNLRN